MGEEYILGVINRPPFDLSGRVVARREVRIGRIFEPGEEIPWQQLACSVHQLGMLWDQALIDTLPPETADGVDPEAEELTNPNGERRRGPTIEEFIAAGEYLPEHYPPHGWAEVPSAGLTAYRSGGEVPWDTAKLDELRKEIAAYQAEIAERQAKRAADDAAREAALVAEKAAEEAAAELAEKAKAAEVARLVEEEMAKVPPKVEDPATTIDPMSTTPALPAFDNSDDEGIVYEDETPAVAPKPTTKSGKKKT